MFIMNKQISTHKKVESLLMNEILLLLHKERLISLDEAGQRTGMALSHVEDAVDRLERLDFLERIGASGYDAKFCRSCLGCGNGLTDLPKILSLTDKGKRYICNKAVLQSNHKGNKKS